MTKEILLTGDRPTGRLHLGHYAGSLKNRVILQNSSKYEQYIFIADLQALTDNARDPEKIRANLIEVALDYLSVGLDPSKSTIFVQSQIPELAELNMYYLNLVNLGRLQRNPTVKSEIKNLEKQGKTPPVGFLTYPISQAADITAFNAKYVPAGEDQEAIVEQTREIVRSFNSIYGEVLTEPQTILADNHYARRMPGIDGNSKMGKSLGNAIYLADEPEVVKKKVMSMYTDPNHTSVDLPGNIENNVPFIYLKVFCTDEHFKKFLPEYANLKELEDHYKKGGLGDSIVKRFLNDILQEELYLIRERRKYYEKRIEEVYEILEQGSKKARLLAKDTLSKVREAIGVEYFKDEELKQVHINKY